MTHELMILAEIFGISARGKAKKNDDNCIELDQ
jgi:hypothetical protein